jgi:hypothetical protein
MLEKQLLTKKIIKKEASWGLGQLDYFEYYL